ncbi:hypothetical protein TNCV_4883391 [Trichonephila clavipes]|nr:hypothetical protein TNCV_4883391 [Trichonephila clavipes]
MSIRRLASESCFYTREKQEVAFDWLDADEREAESGFGWAMKENRVEPLCTQYKERVQQNSVDQWVGKEAWIRNDWHGGTINWQEKRPNGCHALEYAARQGQVRAGIIYQEPTAKRVFVLFCKDHWHQKKTWLDIFKRAIMEAKHANEFRPNDVMWEKPSKGLLRNPDRLLKNTDKRMVYIYNNIFFAKKDFTFGLRTVKSGEIHLIQTTHVPMLIYELPASSLKC